MTTYKYKIGALIVTDVTSSLKSFRKILKYTTERGIPCYTVGVVNQNNLTKVIDRCNLSKIYVEEEYIDISSKLARLFYG
jgi:hypothetical protein